MTPFDWTALTVFAVAWLAYEPLTRRLGHRFGAINTDMSLIRAAWMRAMSGREVRLLDSQLMGHSINSASFFASANLILIAAVAGVLFGGDPAVKSITQLGGEAAPRLLEFKLALVTVCLARGFLDFIWSIRQMNYTVALIGATPDEEPVAARRQALAQAAAEVLNPALTAFSHGVRAYYFSLAAAAWLFGPVYFLAATAAAFTLLSWRQFFSRAARGLHRARLILETTPDPEPKPKSDPKADPNSNAS